MKKKFAALILAAAMTAALAGCGSSGSSSAPDSGASSAGESTAETAAGKDDASLREINVVLDWYPNAVHEFIYNAIDKGYYADEGLKVNVQFPSNTNDALSLTAAGKAQIGIYYPQDVIQARINQNVPVKAFGSICQSPLNIILSLKEKNINSPKDLVGKTVGYAGTELSEAMIKAMMENVGASYDDVTMRDVGFDLMSSMTTGNVDATIGCMVNHEVPQMEKEGFEVSYFDITKYGIPNYPELVLVANDDTIANDSDMLAAFMRASEKGFEDMKNDPEGSVDTLIANQNAENFPLDKDVESKSTQVLLPVMETETQPFLSSNLDDWEKSIQWMVNQKIIDKTCPVGDVVVNIDYKK